MAQFEDYIAASKNVIGGDVLDRVIERHEPVFDRRYSVPPARPRKAVCYHLDTDTGTPGSSEWIPQRMKDR